MATENKLQDMYKLVYDNTNLDIFFEKRFNLDFIPYIEVQNEDETSYKLLDIPGKSVVKENWLVQNKDTKIYRFNNENIYTVILFDSRDMDSVLAKDIIEKQYQDGYNRNTTDWREDGVIIYDIYNNETLYPTLDDNSYFFDLECLSFNGVDEIFVCGYLDKLSGMLKRFVGFNEKVFIFENDPSKINTVRSLLSYKSSNTTSCMSKHYTKAYQAYMLFRDPIGNIKPEDNGGLALLKNYSDMVCCDFDNVEDWEHLELIKDNFELNIVNKDWRAKLVEALFKKDKTVPAFDIEITEEELTEKQAKFESDLKNKGNIWLGEAIAINTDAEPSYEQIKSLVSDNKKYSYVIIYYKGNSNEYWTYKIYKTPRELHNAISTKLALAKDSETNKNIVYYTEGGLPVIKYEEKDIDNNVVGVKWYNIAGNKRVPVNNYIYDNKGSFVFDLEAKEYIEAIISVDGISATRLDGTNINKPLKNDLGVIRKYSWSVDSSNIKFDIVYPTDEEISFNSAGVNMMIYNKYFSICNKYMGVAYLTTKQHYDVERAKTI